MLHDSRLASRPDSRFTQLLPRCLWSAQQRPGRIFARAGPQLRARSEFIYRLLVATTDHLGKTGRRTIDSQGKLAGTALRSRLEDGELDWPASIDALDFPAMTKRKRLRRNQSRAVRDIVGGFETADPRRATPIVALL